MNENTQKMLIILTNGSFQGINQLEAINALLVFSTYGANITVCFSGDAITLLSQTETVLSTTGLNQQPFKSARAIISSFEFYDLLPVWVDSTTLPPKPIIDCISMPLSAQILESFNTILRW